MFEIGLTHYLVVATLLFVMGIFVMITKRNAIGILIGVEMVLNGANINLVAFNRYNGMGNIDGQIVSLFVIVLAAAEAALAVAICMNFYKNLNTVDVDHGDTLAG
ncbi:MAG TPA: NADH-quinone oxidoreductase subunit NuoK [Phycisphaerae bacterium]|nr:NADH-quinone oxidoreductase subunit NuoK [Phycisphaerae bacterium]